MFRAMDNSPLIYNNYRLWLHKRRSAVVIQRHIRGFLARIMYVETMLTNAYDGSPSLLEDDSSASPSLLSISADATANSNTKESKADANSNTKESKADDSSVSSLSTSESIWDKVYHFPEAVTIPSTVAVAAMKSNPVTRSSPCQRQAKRPTVDSPTSSVLSPIEKCRLHVEESSEVVIAAAERKVCRPEDLNVKNGFKLSFSTQTSLAGSQTARIQLVSSDTHANWMLFFEVNVFLSSSKVVIVH